MPSDVDVALIVRGDGAAAVEADVFCDQVSLGLDVLTRAGDVRLLPTPGHTNGHLAVVLGDGETTYFFAGDAAFSETQLLEGEVAGINQDVVATRDTLVRIRELTRRQPVVFLPTHDPASLARLAAKQIVTG